MEMKADSDIFSSDHENDLCICVDSDIRKEIRIIRNRLDIMEKNQRLIMEREEELVNMILETNSLLKCHIGLPKETMDMRFPLRYEHDLKRLDDELCGENRAQIIFTLKKLLGGKVRNNMDKILHFDIIMSYNYDGIKGKKPLKIYEHLIQALYEAHFCEGETYGEFIIEMRNTLRILKNRWHKQDSRNKSRTLKNGTEAQTNDFANSTSNNLNSNISVNKNFCTLQKETANITGSKRSTTDSSCIHVSKNVGNFPNETESPTSRFVKSTSNNQCTINSSNISVENNVSNATTFSCAICAKNYSTRDDFKSHMNTHEDAAVKAAKLCQICWRTFNSPMSLQFHMLSHTSLKKNKRKASPDESESLNTASSSKQLKRKKKRQTSVKNDAAGIENLKKSNMKNKELNFEFVTS